LKDSIPLKDIVLSNALTLKLVQYHLKDITLSVMTRFQSGVLDLNSSDLHYNTHDWFSAKINLKILKGNSKFGAGLAQAV
jgi:hypothetical protein